MHGVACIVFWVALEMQLRREAMSKIISRGMTLSREARAPADQPMLPAQETIFAALPNTSPAQPG